MKRLAVDLVIINERASSYTQDLQIAIETAVRSSQSRRAKRANRRRVQSFMLRADLISAETRALLLSLRACGPVAGSGTLGQRLALLAKPEASLRSVRRRPLPLRAGARRAGRTRVLQWHRRLRRRTDGNMSIDPADGRSDACALDQRHRQSGLRLPGLEPTGRVTPGRATAGKTG